MSWIIENDFENPMRIISSWQWVLYLAYASTFSLVSLGFQCYVSMECNIENSFIHVFISMKSYNFYLNFVPDLGYFLSWKYAIFASSLCYALASSASLFLISLMIHILCLNFSGPLPIDFGCWFSGLWSLPVSNCLRLSSSQDCAVY